MGIYPDAVATWRIVKTNGAGGGDKVAGGILCIDPAFDRMLLKFDIALVELELLPVGDPDLLFD